MKIILFLLYLFIEIFLLVEFGDEFGVFALFAEIILSGIIGFGFIISINNVGGYFINFSNFFNISNIVGSVIFRLIGGILLILPGILCDIVGIIFLIFSFIFTFRKDNENPKNFHDFRFQNFTFKRDSERYNNEDEIIDVEIIEHNDKLNK